MEAAEGSRGVQSTGFCRRKHCGKEGPDQLQAALPREDRVQLCGSGEPRPQVGVISAEKYLCVTVPLSGRIKSCMSSRSPRAWLKFLRCVLRVLSGQLAGGRTA